MVVDGANTGSSSRAKGLIDAYHHTPCPEHKKMKLLIMIRDLHCLRLDGAYIATENNSISRYCKLLFAIKTKSQLQPGVTLVEDMSFPNPS